MDFYLSLDDEKSLTVEHLWEFGETYRDADFAGAGRVHDWRNYIPDCIEKLWLELSSEARGALIVAAQKTADKEHWD